MKPNNCKRASAVACSHRPRRHQYQSLKCRDCCAVLCCATFPNDLLSFSHALTATLWASEKHTHQNHLVSTPFAPYAFLPTGPWGCEPKWPGHHQEEAEGHEEGPGEAGEAEGEAGEGGAPQRQAAALQHRLSLLSSVCSCSRVSIHGTGPSPCCCFCCFLCTRISLTTLMTLMTWI